MHSSLLALKRQKRTKYINKTNYGFFYKIIVERAKSYKQRIVLPEATEERTLRAADRAIGDELAEIILIGNPDVILNLPINGG